MDESPFLKLKRFQWWLLVAINIFFLIAGQAAAVLLGRFYYDKGGNSQWMATLVQTAGFPVLCIPWFLLRPSREASTFSTSPSIKTLALLYFVLGVLVAGDNMLYSVGLLYLSASTYSLICATQLAFNAVFSYFLNSQKFTALILNSVVTLSLSAALIAVNDNSDGPSGVPKEMQIYTSVVASCLSTIGLFASGEWKSLQHEMEVFGTGSVSYVLTLVWSYILATLCLWLLPH
ncbi:putative purine permease 11 -like protein [Gossypium arboreum]|uniref:Putative purine permease 11-like protein n=1 Tax=Gossypium arboreum TaxID=29729 RepID=A0A0B0PQV6_GOSAR|nr:putative purine permease 11 -like protein [Gossypium arboreum]